MSQDHPLENFIPIVREMMDEIYNFSNAGIIDELYHADFVCHTPSQDMNREDFREYVRACRDAVPDLHFRLEDMQQVDDVVFWEIRVMGTHTRELFGIAPSGKAVDFQTSNRMRFADGRPIEQWIGADLEAIVKNLGGR